MKSIRQILLFRLTPILLMALALLLVFIKLEYGSGSLYPDIGSDNAEATTRLERFIRLDYPPGNVVVAPDGHVYFNYHPFARASRFSQATVFEWADGQIRPFPSIEMQNNFQGTFGMTIDRQNRIWFVEPANFDFDHTRLWAFDLQTQREVVFFEFPGDEAQFAQDLRVTADGMYVILANPGIFRFTASNLYVFSVADQTFRVVLDDSSCIQAEDWLMRTPYGPHRLVWGLINFTVGVDGIEISEDQKWVYLAAMTSSRLCRVPLASLLDPNLIPSDLDQQVEDLGQKPMSDGITTDNAGRVILTDVEHGGLMTFDPVTREVSTLVRSKDVIWADGVVTGPEGALYFTDSAIPSYVGQVAGPPDEATLLEHRPYYVYRFER